MDPAELVKGWKTIRSPQRRPLPVAHARELLSQLATDARHTPLHRSRNNAMAYLMLKTGLRTIEVWRAKIEQLQELVPMEKWRLWMHGKWRVSAGELVQVLQEVYERIQAYLALRPGPLQGSDPLFATTACYDRGGAALHAGDSSDHHGGTALSSVVHSPRHSTPTFALLNAANPTRVQKTMRHQHYATTESYIEEIQKLLEGAEEAVTQI